MESDREGGMCVSLPSIYLVISISEYVKSCAGKHLLGCGSGLYWAPSMVVVNPHVVLIDMVGVDPPPSTHTYPL